MKQWRRYPGGNEVYLFPNIDILTVNARNEIIYCDVFAI